MKKRFVYIIAALFLLLSFIAGCNNEVEHVVEYYTSVDEHGKEVKTPKLVYYYKGGDSTNCREVQYFSDGAIKMEGHHVDGVRQGVWTAWYKDGKLWSRGSFKDGLSDGTRRVYHSNGQLYYQGEYEAGNRVGEWIFYDSLGKEIKRTQY